MKSQRDVFIYETLTWNFLSKTQSFKQGITAGSLFRILNLVRCKTKSLFSFSLARAYAGDLQSKRLHWLVFVHCPIGSTWANPHGYRPNHTLILAIHLLRAFKVLFLLLLKQVVWRRIRYSLHSIPK